MTRHQRTVLVSCILATAVVLVDSTVVNVALPAIERDLGGGLAGQQWTSNAYLLTLGSLLLIGGSLGDIFGERRVFSAGVIGFGVTSVLCAVAPTIEVLVAARALQGVAGALLTPAALAVIVNTFPGEQRGRAIGMWTAWAGIGAVLGPLVGGQIVDNASWRWIFAINVPLLVLTLVPDQPHHVRAGADRARQGRPGRGCAVRHGAGGDDLRADRAAAEGLRRPAGPRPAGGRRAAVRGLPGLRAAHPGADAAARPVQAAQLRDRQRPDADPCTAGSGCCSSS